MTDYNGIVIKGVINILSCLFLIYFLCRVYLAGSGGRAQYLRRGDIAIMMVVAFLINIHVAMLLSFCSQGEGKFSKLAMVGLLVLVMFHAVVFPIAIVMRVRRHPKGSTVTSAEMNNLHFVADFFGIISTGVGLGIQ